MNDLPLSRFEGRVRPAITACACTFLHVASVRWCEGDTRPPSNEFLFAIVPLSAVLILPVAFLTARLTGPRRELWAFLSWLGCLVACTLLGAVLVGPEFGSASFAELVERLVVERWYLLLGSACVVTIIPRFLLTLGVGRWPPVS